MSGTASLSGTRWAVARVVFKSEVVARDTRVLLSASKCRSHLLAPRNTSSLVRYDVSNIDPVGRAKAHVSDDPHRVTGDAKDEENH